VIDLALCLRTGAVWEIHAYLMLTDPFSNRLQVHVLSKYLLHHSDVDSRCATIGTGGGAKNSLPETWTPRMCFCCPLSLVSDSWIASKGPSYLKSRTKCDTGDAGIAGLRVVLRTPEPRLFRSTDAPADKRYAKTLIKSLCYAVVAVCL
jgi:hypothetical protein